MKKAVTGRSTLFPQVQRGAGRCKAPPGEAEGGPRASAHNRAEPSVSAGVLPALWAMECGRGASEFRWYRGEIRPEAEEASGLFYYLGIAEPLQTENSGATQCVGTHGNLIPPINEEDGEHEAI